MNGVRTAKIRFPKSRATRGQSLVEGALVMLVFFALLFGVIDCGQLVVTHQTLVERVRAAVRWGSLRPWDGTGDQIANMILYDRPDEPRQAREGYLGLTRANVKVTYRPPVPERPDDEMISVSVVDFSYHFIAPLFIQTIVSPRPVVMSVPMSFRTPYKTPSQLNIAAR